MDRMKVEQQEKRAEDWKGVRGVVRWVRVYRRRIAGAAVFLVAFGAWLAVIAAAGVPAGRSTDPAAPAAILGFIVAWYWFFFGVLGPALGRLLSQEWFQRTFHDPEMDAPQESGWDQ